MKQLLYILLVFVLVGCRGTADTVAEGVLRLEPLNVQVDHMVTPVGKANKAEVLATLETTIYNAADKVVFHSNAGIVLPPTVALPAGQYRIESRTAGNYSQGAAYFDTPLYLGKKQFEIQSGEVTAVELKCSEITASVKVDYSEDFLAIFPADRYRYWVKMTSSIGASIVIESSETRIAFFQVPTSDVNLYYTIFLERKEGDRWVGVWGEGEELKKVSFQVGQKAIEPGVQYAVQIAVR